MKEITQVTLKCNFCGKEFKRTWKKYGPRAMEVRCPKCREYDVEIIDTKIYNPSFR